MRNALSAIQKYAGYFHDGSIHQIIHINNSLVIAMESAELASDWNWDRKNITLSSRNTISGELRFEIVDSIYKNGKILKSKLRMIYRNCEIFDLKILNNKVTFEVLWKEYLPIRKETEIVTIEIEAKDIYWLNKPNLFDSIWREE